MSLGPQFSLYGFLSSERHVLLDTSLCFAQDHEQINMKTEGLERERPRQTVRNRNQNTIRNSIDIYPT